MILDAGVLIAAADPIDRYRAAGRDIWAKGRHKIHSINFAEVVAVLRRKSGSQGHRLLIALANATELTISTEAVHWRAGELHVCRPSKRVSLADCFAAALALESDEVLATTDNDFRPFQGSHGLKLHLLG